MQPTLPLLTLVLGLSALVPACVAPDRATFDELEARRASGNRSAIPAAASSSQPEGWDQVTAPPVTQSPNMGSPVEAGMPVAMTTPLLPRNAAPAPQIAGLGFLTGRWVAINPNKTVNEEIWSPPRGNVLIGSFRQIRLDGDCAFVELSQIAVQGEEIVLRLRHLHGELQVPEGRGDISLFRLVSLTKDRVEFTGTSGAESVTSVVYERKSETELQQSIGFAPESGQADFVTRYQLDR